MRKKQTRLTLKQSMTVSQWLKRNEKELEKAKQQGMTLSDVREWVQRQTGVPLSPNAFRRIISAMGNEAPKVLVAGGWRRTTQPDPKQAKPTDRRARAAVRYLAACLDYIAEELALENLPAVMLPTVRAILSGRYTTSDVKLPNGRQLADIDGELYWDDTAKTILAATGATENSSSELPSIM